MAALDPPVAVDVSEAAGALLDFAHFWDHEPDPQERNKLLRVIFEQVWVRDRRIVAVMPRPAFVPYFQFGTLAGGGERRERRDSNPRKTPHRDP